MKEYFNMFHPDEQCLSCDYCNNYLTMDGVTTVYTCALAGSPTIDTDSCLRNHYSSYKPRESREDKDYEYDWENEG